MKRVLYCLSCVMVILCFLPISTMAASTHTLTSGEQELKRKLNTKLTPTERMHTLYKLSTYYRDEPAERDYTIRLFNQAVKLDSIDKIEYAIYTLTRYYYNSCNIDSLNYWSHKIDDFHKGNHPHSDAYFRIRNLACQYICWGNPNEVVANEVLRLYHLAIKEKNQIGIYSSCETLGVAYSSMGQDSIAIKYYFEGIDNLDKSNIKNPVNKLAILELTISSLLNLSSPEGTEKYISEFGRIIDDVEHHRDVYPKIPVNRCLLLYNSYWTRYFINKGSLDKSLTYLQKGKTLLDKVDDRYAKYFYYLSATFYYKANKEYDNALKSIDEVIKYGSASDIYIIKADILTLMGKDREANVYYKLAIRQGKKEYDMNFFRQMNQLSHLQDINAANQAHNEETIKRKQLQIMIVLCFFGFTALLLLLSIIYTIHNRHTKRILQLERDKLIESRNDLKIAKEKAVQADHLKSLFLANMSHEIRTPLNAIVGFSQILCDSNYDINDDDKNNFSGLISHNSDLLLNLINDILDISKLEANVYKFDFAQSDIEECCAESIESVRHLISPDVNLSFVSHKAPFMLYTDKLRLRQVIINLLTNSSKFTKNGSITLRYGVDYDKSMVEFSVTDTGCGIPREKRKVIFNRFEKLNDYAQGTGLGLAISALIVKQFGGKIWVDDGYNEGTRFIFTHKM